MPKPSDLFSVNFFLCFTALSSVAHGGEGDGSNTIPLHRQQIFDQLRGRAVHVPAISAASIRALLREQAVLQQLEVQGLGDLSKELLRLLTKGGKLGGPQGQSISLAQLREVVAGFPLLGVFGAMDDNYHAAGKLTVHAAMPLTSTTAQLQHMAELGRRFGVQPVESSSLTTEETGYRHDLSMSPVAALMDAGSKAAIEDAAASKKAKKAAGTALTAEDRRSDTDAMPHTCEVLTAGHRLLSMLRLQLASEAELMTLTLAIARWRAHSIYLGGQKNAGRGLCTLDLQAERIRGLAGPMPVRLDGVDLPAHVESMPGADDVARAWLDKMASPEQIKLTERAMQILRGA